MKTSPELHRKTFELTLALYRVTDFFPQGEILKRQLREKANEIFGNVTEYGYTDGREQEPLILLAKVETMKGYLRVARSMRLVRPINLTILEREYEFLEHFFKQELVGSHVSGDRDQNPIGTSCNQQYDQQVHDVPRAKDSERSRPPEKGTARKAQRRGSTQRIANMTDRQKKILGYVEKASQAKIGDLSIVLTGVSAKTIQRDLHDLVQKDILKKDGQKRWTTYSLL